MNKDYEKIVDLLGDFKTRYDLYAGTLIRLRNHVPSFIKADTLFENFYCECPKDNFFISSYPAATEKFIGHILVTCGSCYGSFIPKVNIDLEEYYTKHYQSDVQQFRLDTGNFFQRFSETDAFKQFSKRANLLLSISNDLPKKRIIDIGCGVGVLLKLSQSRYKYAVEPDPYSQKILRNELKVSVFSEIPENLLFLSLIQYLCHMYLNIMTLKKLIQYC